MYTIIVQGAASAVSATKRSSAGRPKVLRKLVVMLAVVVAVGAPHQAAGQACAGDCDADGFVTVDEIVLAVNVALGTQSADSCQPADRNADGAVTVDEILQSLNAALVGCPARGVQIEGACRRPGVSGLVACSGGTVVRAFRCVERNRCLTERDGLVAVGSTQVGPDGGFVLTVDPAMVANALLVFEADIDQATTYRTVSFGRSEESGARTVPRPILIEPSAEAAVRLLAEIGLPAFSDIAILVVVDAVIVANTATDFAGLTVTVAIQAALNTARQDPGVQQAISQNQLTPTPTHVATLTRTPTATPEVLLEFPGPVLHFASTIAASGSISKTGTVDVDGNDVPDLIVFHNSGAASLLVGAGNGQFRSTIDLREPTPPVAAGLLNESFVGLADFTGDDIRDLVVDRQFIPPIGQFDGTHELQVIPGNPLGGFLPSRLSTSYADLLGSSLPPSVSNAGDVVIGDFDGDGDSDLGAASGAPRKLTTFLSDRAGRFTHAVVGPDFPEGLGALGAGDFNGDGIDDIVVGRDGQVFVFLASGGGSFAQPTSFATASLVRDIAIADLDGDLALDIVAVNSRTATSSQVTILFGRGNGGFLSTALDVGFNLWHGTTSDLNDDGLADIVVNGESAAGVGAVFISYGEGNGAFGTPEVIRTYDTVGPVLAADLNADQFTDLVAGPVVLLGLGPDVLHKTVQVPDVRADVRSHLVADVDGDGIQDIVGVFGIDRVVLFRGIGNGVFAESSELPMNGERLAFGDVDGDGIDDLISSGSRTYIARGPVTTASPEVLSISDGVGSGLGAARGLVLVRDDTSSPLAIGFPRGGAIRLWSYSGDGFTPYSPTAGRTFVGNLDSADLDGTVRATWLPNQPTARRSWLVVAMGNFSSASSYRLTDRTTSRLGIYPATPRSMSYYQ